MRDVPNWPPISLMIYSSIWIVRIKYVLGSSPPKIIGIWWLAFLIEWVKTRRERERERERKRDICFVKTNRRWEYIERHTSSHDSIINYRLFVNANVACETFCTKQKLRNPFFSLHNNMQTSGTHLESTTTTHTQPPTQTLIIDCLEAC